MEEKANETTVEVEALVEKEVKTFTRDEVNKMIATEKKRVREDALKEMEAEKTEAERLAKLSSEERYKEELVKANKIANEATSKLNAYELKEQTIKDNSDIPVSLINLINFTECNTAELVKDRLEIIKATYKTAVEEGINKSMQESTPKTVVQDTTPQKKNVSRYSI